MPDVSCSLFHLSCLLFVVSSPSSSSSPCQHGAKALDQNPRADTPFAHQGVLPDASLVIWGQLAPSIQTDSKYLPCLVLLIG